MRLISVFFFVCDFFSNTPKFLLLFPRAGDRGWSQHRLAAPEEEAPGEEGEGGCVEGNQGEGGHPPAARQPRVLIWQFLS